MVRKPLAAAPADIISTGFNSNPSIRFRQGRVGRVLIPASPGAVRFVHVEHVYFLIRKICFTSDGRGLPLKQVRNVDKVIR
jgi:hypothetical protein